VLQQNPERMLLPSRITCEFADENNNMNIKNKITSAFFPDKNRDFTSLNIILIFIL